MSVLITGAAGFIGARTAHVLLDRGETVVGIDNLNDYYEVELKEARLAALNARDGFVFERVDITEREAMAALIARHPDIDRVIHLAAQAGVRYSLINPYTYTQTNIEGFLILLEELRKLKNLAHLVYASSSSVYGANSNVPFSVEDRCDEPVSLYAATKKASEMMAHTYSHLYRLPITGLRFFTVYGPEGRPDMAPFIFIRKILANESIPVFNHGDMRRDFTYIDDIVQGVIGCLDNPPFDEVTTPPCRVYNIGNNKAENLMDFIGVFEDALGTKANLHLLPMQPGDVKTTYADIEPARRDFGYAPTTSIYEGIPRFVAWYKEFYGV